MRDRITGTVAVYTLSKDGSKTLLFKSHNQIQDDYAKILPLLMSGNPDGKINTLYLEYKNVASPSDTVEVTPFETNVLAEHYTNLSGDTDFIRHRLVMTPTAGDGYVEFTAVIGAETGFHNLPFGESGYNSRVYSMALVAAKSENDQTQDLIFARKHWDTQKIKTDEQLFITWRIDFAR